MENTFEEEFYRRVELIKARAKKAGTNITHLCRESGVSRTTPERWEKRVPKSIALIDQMMAVLREIEREKEANEKALEALSPRERQRLEVEQTERMKEEQRHRRERRNELRRLSRQKQRAAEE
jgi:lambda repressor-like predicted transcriptional regulator